MAYYLENESASVDLGKRLAPLLRPGMLISLEGDLGAGKTTLIRACLEACGVAKGEVHSPSFSLVHEYEAQDFSVAHCDFYRLSEGDMLDDLGGMEFFYQKKLFFLEWASRLGIRKLFPSERSVEISLWEEEGKAGRFCSLPQNWESVLF